MNAQVRLPRFIYLFAILLFAQTAFAQHSHGHRCGFDHMLEKLKAKDDNYQQFIDNYLKEVLPTLSNRATPRMNATINVPIVVHLIHPGDAEGTGANLSTERIQAQIDVLNEDFSANNSNYDNTPSRWAASVGNPNVQFCLAAIDPNGNPTTGITRNQMTVTGTDTNNSNIESEIKPAINWDPNRYYNIYVLAIPGTTAGGGVTGYAYLPYSGTIGNGSTDGSVVDYRWFGGPGYGQSGDKTLTHETGHYLGLFHPFNGESCSNDDGIDDTPNISSPTSDAGFFGCNGGFPTGPQSCGNEHMYINYMDYSASSCYTSFTNGQINVMRAVLDGTAGTLGFGSRATLANNAVTVCTLFGKDAAISSIVHPAQQYCATNSEAIDPIVQLTNFGTETLTSVKINYQVDGGAVVSYDWTGSLEAGASANVTLTEFLPAASPFTFVAYTELPNGGTDEQISNDSSAIQAAYVSPAPANLAEAFTSTDFDPSTEGITVFNVDDDSYSWEHNVFLSAFGLGMGSAEFDNYSANQDIINTLDALLTPVYDFTSVSGASLTFDVAYAMYQDASFTLSDTLLIMVSTDCGAVYDQVVFQQGGSTLATASPTNSRFAPTANEWRSVQVDLSDYDNRSDISIALVNKSGWGNMLYLDNISLSLPCVMSVSDQVNAATCANTCDGTATVTATGGLGTYTYQWSAEAGSGTTNTAGNLCAGSYSVTVSDAGGCVQVKTVEVQAPDPIVINMVTNDESSMGSNDGSITATPMGGTAPFTYLWDNGANTATITGLAPGIYTVTITDSQACTMINEASVAEGAPDCIGFSTQPSVVTPTSCHDRNDGAITVFPMGGMAPYTFAWSNGATTATIENLAAATYAYTITDALGCQIINNEQVESPDPVEVAINATNESAAGANDGVATANVAGGTAPYTYLWQNGATTSSINNLSPGIYTLTVTDVNQCTAIQEVEINAGAVDCNGFGGNVNFEPVSCFGFSDGWAVVVPFGGVTPYSYAWSNNTTNAIVESLEAGIYTVVVTDQFGCTYTEEVEITSPEAIQIQVSTTAESTNGAGDASASATVNGGTPPYNYNWGPGLPNTASIDSLSAGTYTLQISDANQCIAEQTVEILVSIDCSSFGLDIAPTNTSCSGIADGTATAFPFNGEGPYTFLWSNGQTGATASFLAEGLYTVLITDSRNCETEGQIYIDSPDPLGVEVTTNNASDPLAEDGSASATPNGGTPPYTYVWDTGANTATVDGLAPGAYQLEVIDINGCITTVTVSIGAEAVDCSNLSVDQSSEMVTCFGASDGTATVYPAGGIAPYSFAWDNGQTGATAEQLSSGIYVVTILDAFDCEFITEVEVASPPELNTEMNATNESVAGMADGTASVAVEGGTSPYTYTWNTGATTQMITNLSPGVYEVLVTDANGCTNMGTTSVSDGLIDCTVLGVEVEVQDGLCGGLGIAIAYPVNGVAPYSYEWSNGQSGPQINQLIEGTYSLTLTDANDCSAVSTIEVDLFDGIVLEAEKGDVTCANEANGFIELTMISGNPPYQISWNTGDTGPILEDLEAGTYTANVTDALGCVEVSSFQIIAPPALNTTFDTQSPSDFNADDGMIIANAFGGTTPYEYQWSNGGSGVVNDGLSIGWYTLTLTDANDCQMVDSVYLDLSLTSVNTIESITQFQLFPNPTADAIQLYMQFDQSENVELSLYNVIGQNIWKKQQQGTEWNETLDLSQEAAGTYWLRIRTAEAQMLRKIIRIE